MATSKINQDRHPNFRDKKGNLFLVRCYNCDTERGRENWAMAVAAGVCAWCGWTESKKEAKHDKEIEKDNKEIR